MKGKREVIRKTIGLDKELVSNCEVLYNEAGVDNFTQFAVNALQMYTDISSVRNSAHSSPERFARHSRMRFAP